MMAARTLRWKAPFAAVPLAILAVLASVTAARAAVSTSHISSDEEALTLIGANGGGFRFSADAALKGHPLGDLSLQPTAVPDQGGPVIEVPILSWLRNSVVPFTLTYDGVSQAILTVTPRTTPIIVTNLPDFSIAPDLNELFVRADALLAGSSATVSNLVLNGVAVSGTSVAVAGSSGGIDILRIRGGSLAGGFTLTGSITMVWPGLNRPSQTSLSMQIWGAKVVGDATPPVVAITAPAGGSFLATAKPTITAFYSDASSGIDVASVRLLVDGVDRTSAAQVTGSGLTYTPAAGLAEGAHAVVVKVKDLGQNPAESQVQFVTDTVAPTLTLEEPDLPVVREDVTPTFRFSWGDQGSGIDPLSFSLTLDGTDYSSSCQSEASETVCEGIALQPGTHTVAALIGDRAGNTADFSGELEIVVDSVDPTVTILEPLDLAYFRLPDLIVRGNAADETFLGSVVVNDLPVSIVGGSFESPFHLLPGENSIVVTATDGAGNRKTAQRTVFLDQAPPKLVVDKPNSGQIANGSEIEVAGRVTDDFELEELTLNGVTLPAPDGEFSAQIAVPSGESQVVVRALDRAGNAAELNVPIERLDLPDIAILDPVNFRFVAATTMEVSGTVSDPAATVEVEGRPAVVSGTSFSISDVPLIEGGNLITAIAHSPSGAVGSATVSVVRDLTPPQVVIETPANGAEVSTPTVTVAGLVNDIVAGTVNAEQATVSVNGQPASVTNRTFVADGVVLLPGDNEVEVVAVDEAGNRASATIEIRRAASSSSLRLVVTSGSGQTGEIGAPLSQPLTVTAVDAGGQPVSGKVVVFRVRDNDGRLGDPGSERLVASTDALGRASASLRLGLRAGVQLVEAMAPGSEAPVEFVLRAEPASAANIVVDSGDQQVGVAGQHLSRPLVAVVTDRAWNRLGGVTVGFRVVKGAGLFPNQQDEILVSTDSDGRAIVPFRIDPEEGTVNNAVEARLVDFQESQRISFTASGMAAGPPEATSISGVVLDNSNLPVEGVSVRIDETTILAVTDAQGRFRIAPAPVGTALLIIDGSTTNRPGQWPSLEFFLPIIPGRDNTVRMPIYLLPLDSGNRLTVDETHGGKLTIDEVPGFALDVLPGSVVFPGGSRSGVVNVTVVHNDKVPMVPNFGQQPRFIVTIQPAGARFDPPARLTLPNVEGLAPGEVTEMYSFDHDLGSFVSIGPAIVSGDGTEIKSKLGVGVIKAGWHCGGNPRASATVHRCDACEVCEKPLCVPGPDGPNQRCSDSDPCTFDYCDKGKCVHQNFPYTEAFTLSVPLGKVFPDTATEVTAYASSFCPGKRIDFSASNESPTFFDGGHEHPVAGRPLGRFRPTYCITNSLGFCRVTYTTSIAAGLDRIEAQSFLTTLHDWIFVGRDDLLQLGGDDGVPWLLIGQTPTHPSNHWGTSNTLWQLQQIAEEYNDLYPQDEVLYLNDISLEWGGLFDHKATWAGPHERHRKGTNVDIRLGTIPQGNRAEFIRIARLHGAVPDIHNGDHFHLTFAQ